MSPLHVITPAPINTWLAPRPFAVTHRDVSALHRDEPAHDGVLHPTRCRPMRIDRYRLFSRVSTALLTDPHYLSAKERRLPPSFYVDVISASNHSIRIPGTISELLALHRAVSDDDENPTLKRVAIEKSIASHPRCPKSLAERWLKEGKHIREIYRNRALSIYWLVSRSPNHIAHEGLKESRRIRAMTPTQRKKFLAYLIKRRKLTPAILDLFYSKTKFRSVEDFYRGFFELMRDMPIVHYAAARYVLTRWQHIVNDDTLHVSKVAYLGRILDEHDFEGLPSIPLGLPSRLAI